MKPFITANFIQKSPSGKVYIARDSYIDSHALAGTAYSYPYMINDTAYTSVLETHVPLGELDVHTGMEVQATNGKVGKVDKLVLDKRNGAVTHIQMREGHLRGKKDVAIPVSSIDFCGEKTIYLKIDKAAVEALPPVKMKR
jgi:hypothetical protein